MGLRKRYPAIWQDPVLAIEHDRVDEHEHLVTVRRDHALVIANLGSAPIDFTAPEGGWSVVYQSWPLHAPTGGPAPSTIAGETTIVLLRDSA